MLNRWSNLGVREASTGATLIGQVPHVAPEAWLHSFYQPLVKQEVKMLEDYFNLSFPKAFRHFLLLSNGLNIFSDSLCVLGIRENYERDGDSAWQPYDIVLHNYPSEKPGDATAKMVFVGGYNWDGSHLYFDAGSADPERIFRCTANSITPLNSWDNFWVMLYDETRRLSRLYDECGKKIDPDAPTVPALS